MSFIFPSRVAVTRSLVCCTEVPELTRALAGRPESWTPGPEVAIVYRAYLSTQLSVRCLGGSATQTLKNGSIHSIRELPYSPPAIDVSQSCGWSIHITRRNRRVRKVSLLELHTIFQRRRSIAAAIFQDPLRRLQLAANVMRREKKTNARSPQRWWLKL